MTKFKFALNAEVYVKGIKQVGVIEARAEYTNYPSQYYCITVDRYTGDIAKEWYPEKDIVPLGK